MLLDFSLLLLTRIDAAPPSDFMKIFLCNYYLNDWVRLNFSAIFLLKSAGAESWCSLFFMVMLFCLLTTKANNLINNKYVHILCKKYCWCPQVLNISPFLLYSSCTWVLYIDSRPISIDLHVARSLQTSYSLCQAKWSMVIWYIENIFSWFSAILQRFDDISRYFTTVHVLT